MGVGGLAQLVRASPLHGEGQRFDSASLQMSDCQNDNQIEQTFTFKLIEDRKKSGKILNPRDTKQSESRKRPAVRPVNTGCVP